MSSDLRQGDLASIDLSPVPGDSALVRVLAVPERDLLRDGQLPVGLAPFQDAVLVEVMSNGHVALPGAWVRPEVIRQAHAAGHQPVGEADLRLPAVVIGDGSRAALHWGETIWPLPFDDSVAIPSSCRPHAHSLPELRRLVLAATGRRSEIALTLWQQPDFEVPWHDVRLVPRPAWWFELAQVPAGMRYRDAVAVQRGLG